MVEIDLLAMSKQFLQPFFEAHLNVRTEVAPISRTGPPGEQDSANKGSDVLQVLKKSHWSIGKDAALTQRRTGFDSQMSHFLLHLLPFCAKILTFW